MKARKLISAFCGVTLLSAPLVHSDAAAERTMLLAAEAGQPAASAAVESTEKLLSSAMAEYIKNERTLSSETQKQLLLQKESVLPFVQQGILLAPDRMRFAAGSNATGYAAYDEWGFWLEIAKLLHDERLLPTLLQWPVDKRPLPDPYRLQEAIDALLPPGKEGTLLPLLERASEPGVDLLLSLYARRVPVTEQKMRDWLTRYAKAPAIGGFVSVIAGLPGGKELLKARFGQTPGATQLDRAIIGQIREEKDRDWLKQIARTTADAYIEQTIDMPLAYNHGDAEAIRRLYESGEKSGYQVQLTGPAEKLIVARYPGGMLAKGIKQYEAITGKPYFFGSDDEGWYKAKGTDYDQPQTGIARWQAFLQTYPNHPAADDAAYRLARCYQIAGAYDQALVWFERAMTSGDADMGYDASGQYVYVLDVNMGQDDFAKLEKTQLPEWKKVWVGYSKAVDTLRANRYAEAANELQQLIARYDGTDVFADSVLQDAWYDQLAGYSFWDNVKHQLATAQKLAALQQAAAKATGADKASKQYALAAASYHDEMTYYNYLWRGERQTFFWIGQIREMEYNESLDRYIGRFNHLLQAEKQFAAIALDQADPTTGANALYSRALCDSKLTGYGLEVSFHVTRAALVTSLLATGEQLLQRYPDSELADDMLVLMYRYSHDGAYLQQLLTRYPKGDQVPEAKRLQQEGQQTPGPNAGDQRPMDYLSRLPYQILSENDWRKPVTIQKWMEGELAGGQLVEATKEDSGWMYVLIRPEKSKIPTISGFEVDHNNSYVYYWLGDAAKTETASARHAVLIRVPTRFLPKGEVKFQLA